MARRYTMDITPAPLAPDEAPYDDTAERDDELIQVIFANAEHLRRLRGGSYDHLAPRAAAAPPWA